VAAEDGFRRLLEAGPEDNEQMLAAILTIRTDVGSPGFG
jgi:hypothetical protein